MNRMGRAAAGARSATGNRRSGRLDCPALLPRPRRGHGSRRRGARLGYRRPGAGAGRSAGGRGPRLPLRAVARASAVLGLALFCIAFVLLPLAGRLFRAQHSALTMLARRRVLVDVVVRVTDDPRVLPGRGLSGAERVVVAGVARSVAPAGAQRASATGVSGGIAVLGPAQGWTDVIPGQSVRVRGTLLPSPDGGLSVTLFARGPPEMIGKPPWWQRAAQHVRSDLRQACRGLPVDVAGLLPGLVDGDTRAVNPVLSEQFRAAGLTHLVAVSGTNCSIVIGAVLLVLRRLRVSAVGGVVAGAAALIVFRRRGTAVAERAACRADGGVALVCARGGRATQALPILPACVLALLAWNPPLAVERRRSRCPALATAALLRTCARLGRRAAPAADARWPGRRRWRSRRPRTW